MVDIRAVRPLPRPVTLEAVKAEKRLATMALVTNSRLSVQPVTAAEWAIVCEMGGLDASQVRPRPRLTEGLRPKHHPPPACRTSLALRHKRCLTRLARRPAGAEGFLGRSPVSDKVYDVPAEWAKRAWVDEAQYEEMYKRSINDPDGFWGEHGKRIDWFKPYTKVKNIVVRSAQRLDQVVRGRRHQRRLQLHRSPSAQARRPDRDHLGRRRSVEVQAHHLRRTRRPGRPFRQCAERPRRQEGRPRHDLSADDPRDGLRDAGLRAHRRDPFGRVRRLLARRARRPHRGRQVGSRHHRRRGPARRPQGAAEGQRRRRRREGGRRQDT